MILLLDQIRLTDYFQKGILLGLQEFEKHRGSLKTTTGQHLDLPVDITFKLAFPIFFRVVHPFTKYSKLLGHLTHAQ